MSTWHKELQHERTPPSVKAWICSPPAWLEVRPPSRTLDGTLEELDPGEQEAIILAEELHADLLILDDKAARAEAARRHLTIIGTLRFLEDGAARELLDLPAAIAQMRKTTFRADSTLLNELLARDAERKKQRVATKDPPKTR